MPEKFRALFHAKYAKCIAETLYVHALNIKLTEKCYLFTVDLSVNFIKQFVLKHKNKHVSFVRFFFL